MTPAEPPAADEPLRKIASEASARIRAADAKAHEAQAAFAAGEFREFFEKQLAETRKRMQDEYEEATGSPTSGGDS